ncbi:MAG TPA: hypothetical protein VFQ54_01400, partial [Thermomicrobiales bacterium]|nr:hypothetical protein [Thermomicrobiales bacterium]
TVSYRRVRLRRATIWYPDASDSREELRRVAAESGMAMLDETTPDGGLIVLLPESGDDGAAVEEDLLKALRAAGYVGQWSTSPARPSSSQSAAIEPSVTPASSQRRPRRPRQS